MASNQTTNYGLHLWEPEDDFLRTEFNENNEKVDAALGEIALAGLKLVSGSYIGDGSTTKRLTFPFSPKLIFISINAAGAGHSILVNGQEQSCNIAYNTYGFSVSWEDSSVTFSTGANATVLCNSSGQKYYYCAIG